MQIIFSEEVSIINSIGARLKTLRTQNNLKQSDIADKINISTSNVSRIEKDWLLNGNGNMFILNTVNIGDDTNELITSYSKLDNLEKC